jgi:hypothetical protein
MQVLDSLLMVDIPEADDCCLLVQDVADVDTRSHPALLVSADALAA